MRSTQPNHGVYLDLLRPLCTELSNNAPKQLKQACVSTTAKFASASIFNYPAIKCTNRQRLASFNKMLLICSKNGTIPGWHTYHGAYLNPLVHFVSSSQTMLSKQFEPSLCVPAASVRICEQISNYPATSNALIASSLALLIRCCSIAQFLDDMLTTAFLSTTFSSTLHQQALKQWFLHSQETCS